MLKKKNNIRSIWELQMTVYQDSEYALLCSKLLFSGKPEPSLKHVQWYNTEHPLLFSLSFNQILHPQPPLQPSSLSPFVQTPIEICSPKPDILKWSITLRSYLSMTWTSLLTCIIIHLCLYLWTFSSHLYFSFSMYALGNNPYCYFNYGKLRSRGGPTPCHTAHWVHQVCGSAAWVRMGATLAVSLNFTWQVRWGCA